MHDDGYGTMREDCRARGFPPSRGLWTWIPAYAGMTWEVAGMALAGVGIVDLRLLIVDWGIGDVGSRLRGNDVGGSGGWRDCGFRRRAATRANESNGIPALVFP